jgi:hypothetical protein
MVGRSPRIRSDRRSWSAFGPHEGAKSSAMVSIGEHWKCLTPLPMSVFPLVAGPR